MDKASFDCVPRSVRHVLLLLLCSCSSGGQIDQLTMRSLARCALFCSPLRQLMRRSHAVFNPESAPPILQGSNNATLPSTPTSSVNMYMLCPVHLNCSIILELITEWDWPLS